MNWALRILGCAVALCAHLACQDAWASQGVTFSQDGEVDPICYSVLAPGMASHGFFEFSLREAMGKLNFMDFLPAALGIEGRIEYGGFLLVYIYC